MLTLPIAWIQRCARTLTKYGLSLLMRTDFCILRRRRGCSLWRMPVGRPDTILDYGRRVAWYLSWCALTMDWRKATLSHLALWRRTVAA